MEDTPDPMNAIQENQHDGFDHKTWVYLKRHTGNKLPGTKLSKSKIIYSTCSTYRQHCSCNLNTGILNTCVLLSLLIECTPSIQLLFSFSCLDTNKLYLLNVLLCMNNYGAFSCIGISRYKHMNAGETCQEDMSNLINLPPTLQTRRQFKALVFL